MLLLLSLFSPFSLFFSSVPSPPRPVTSISRNSSTTLLQSHRIQSKYVDVGKWCVGRMGILFSKSDWDALGSWGEGGVSSLPIKFSQLFDSSAGTCTDPIGYVTSCFMAGYQACKVVLSDYVSLEGRQRYFPQKSTSLARGKIMTLVPRATGEEGGRGTPGNSSSPPAPNPDPRECHF